MYKDKPWPKPSAIVMLSEAKHLLADPSLHSGSQTLAARRRDHRGTSLTLPLRSTQCFGSLRSG